MTSSLRGVLVALATPFAADGSIDVPRLRQLVDRTIDGGVHGVVACGSTGEFSALTGDERRLVVETVVDQTARRVPVVAQTGSTSTAGAIELTRHAESVGVDVVMPVAPFYEALNLAETKHYLRRVASSVSIPVMLYNLPAPPAATSMPTPSPSSPSRSRTSRTSRTPPPTWLRPPS